MIVVKIIYVAIFKSIMIIVIVIIVIHQENIPI